MALMITSIGLVSVATLFPLSILRSIKATQLTSATDVRYNAEAAIDRYPNMITNPVNANYATTLLGNVAAADPPVTHNYVIDPLGFSALASLNSGNGLTSPASSVTLNQNRYEHWFGNDPSNGTAQPAWTVNPPGAPWVQNTPFGTAPSWGIARYPMTWRPSPQVAGTPIPVTPSTVAAHYLVTLPDSWLLQNDTIGGTLGIDNKATITINGSTVPDGTQITQVTLPGLSYPTTTPPSPALRVVIFSADGLTCQTRNVTAINGTTVVWTEDYDGTGTYTAAKDLNGNGKLDNYPLPAGFSPNAATIIGTVRLEAQDPRYTWLLTIRQPTVPNGTADIDVVVFFNRSMENIATDELLYYGAFTLGSTQVTVTYPTGNNTVTNQPLKPFMKKGGFVFDANNAYWYRISNVFDNPLVPGTTILTLEVPANASNTNLIDPNTQKQIQPRAMFPRNIVDVFPLGSKP